MTNEQIGIVRGMIERHGSKEPAHWLTVNNAATNNYELLIGWLDRGWVQREEEPAKLLQLMPQIEAFSLTDLGAVEIGKLLVDEPEGDQMHDFSNGAQIPTSALDYLRKKS
jgi:hypothetical protein